MQINTDNDQAIISIIIVAYNEEKYISKCIDSVIKQNTSLNYEIIIGDDGSNDNTVKIIETYKELYPEVIKFFIQKREDEEEEEAKLLPSRRVTNVITRALQLSSGKYIIILAGDDFCCDDCRIQKQYSIISSKANDDCIAVASNWYNYYDDKSFNLGVKNRLLDGLKLSSRQYEALCYFHISSIMFKNIFTNEIIDKLNYNFLDDCGMTSYLLTKGKIIFKDFPSFCYRQRENSIMSNLDNTHNSVIEMLLCQEQEDMHGGNYDSIKCRHYVNYIYLYKNGNLIDEAVKPTILKLSKEHMSDMLYNILISRNATKMTKYLIVFFVCWLYYGFIYKSVFYVKRYIDKHVHFRRPNENINY